MKAEALGDDFASIVSGSPEAAMAAADGSRVGAPGEAAAAMAPAAMGKQEALEQFSIDLTERAREPARSIRSSGAMRKSARSSMC